ncbi:hypothetical protein [Stenomitos frigidus]|uniref:hypothetical protein n=1 Tax=Stenomitos frigidus TaxID=1886765 RepID=UPI001FE31804|nr:hypothetical protein [Stenomitos frigidus]
MNPRPLKRREHALIARYSDCQLGMTPQRFYAKWEVSQESVAKPVRSTYRDHLLSLHVYSATLVQTWEELSSSHAD